MLECSGLTGPLSRSGLGQARITLLLCSWMNLYFHSAVGVVTGEFNFPCCNSKKGSIQKFQTKFIYQSAGSFAVNLIKIL